LAETAEPPVEPRPRFYHALWLPLGKLLASLFFLLFGPYRVRGAYRVPKKGPVLILPNHIADLDPPFVQVACPRGVRFMAKSELFEMKIIGPIIRYFGGFPVKRGEPDRNAIRKSVELLKAGEALVIFPEGQLSEDGELQELKPGVALIARMAGCPVICCGLKGTNKVMPYGKLIPRPAFSMLEATWGEVRQFDKSATTEEILEWITAQLRELTS
jgi:1-acyl-sn-glycerol-3-phosphate acyltransferase